MCVILEGIEKLGDPFVHASDGALHIRIDFRMVVFKPFISEVIVGSVSDADATGMFGKCYLCVLDCALLIA